MGELRAEPHLFVIFGATGDLSKRNLIPAIATLARGNRLGQRHAILGVSTRPDFNDEKFREIVEKALKDAGVTNGDDMGQWCWECLHAHSIGKGRPENFEALRKKIEEVERRHELPGNRLFYLSTPPQVFAPTIMGLGESRLNKGPGWTRLVIEKPFGRDLQSALELNALVHTYFDESQIYRIDHYLGKETVQNLFVFRFSNFIFESLWHRDRIASVDVLVAEDLGVEGRAGFYENNGAVRDIMQNHATQLVSLIAMEPPSTAAPEAIRTEKIKLLHAIQRIREEDVILGQYTAGTARGQAVPGYLEEDGVAPDSRTDTFAAVRLRINNWRWQGVPFIVRTGKRLQRRVTQIVVTFRSAPVTFFRTMGRELAHPNALVLRLQPDEGFELGIQVKEPGDTDGLQVVPLSFSYADAFGKLPTAYETLLLDVLSGDQTLFVHAIETETAWRLFTPVLERESPVYSYPAGSWGPDEMDRLYQPGEEDPVRCKRIS